MATEDELVFGERHIVYCAEHLHVHAAGWCTVSADRKVDTGLRVPVALSGAQEVMKAAVNKCRSIGLIIGGGPVPPEHRCGYCGKLATLSETKTKLLRCAQCEEVIEVFRRALLREQKAKAKKSNGAKR